MLAKKNRLTQERAFNKIKKSGNTFRTRYFTIKYLVLSGGLSHFTVVVGKKHVPKATMRNYIKRRLRYLVGKYQHKFTRQVDMMIIANDLVRTSKFVDLEKEFLWALNKCQLIKNEY